MNLNDLQPEMFSDPEAYFIALVIAEARIRRDGSGDPMPTNDEMDTAVRIKESDLIPMRMAMVRKVCVNIFEALLDKDEIFGSVNPLVRAAVGVGISKTLEEQFPDVE